MTSALAPIEAGTATDREAGMARRAKAGNSSKPNTEANNAQ